MKDQSHYHLNLAPPAFVVPRQGAQSGGGLPVDNGKLIYFCALCSFPLQKMNMPLAWLTPEVNCFKSTLNYMLYVKQCWIGAGPLLLKHGVLSAINLKWLFIENKRKPNLFLIYTSYRFHARMTNLARWEKKKRKKKPQFFKINYPLRDLKRSTLFVSCLWKSRICF